MGSGISQPPSALHTAVEQQDERMIVSLIGGEMLSVDARDDHGRTPLCRAARNGSTRIVILLLQLHAAPDLTDFSGMSALHYASEANHPAVISELLSNHYGKRLLEARSHDGVTPLCLAVHHNAVDAVAALLEAGARLDTVDPDGDTPLMAAALFGHTECVQLLLEAGADPNVMDTQRHTALHKAILAGHVACTRTLLNSPTVQVQTHDKFQVTPLHSAAQKGWSDVCSVILQRCKDDALRVAQCFDVNGRSPLFYAVESAILECVQLFLAIGLRALQRDNDQQTPLQVCHQLQTTTMSTTTRLRLQQIYDTLLAAEHAEWQQLQHRSDQQQTMYGLDADDADYLPLQQQLQHHDVVDSGANVMGPFTRLSPRRRRSSVSPRYSKQQRRQSLSQSGHRRHSQLSVSMPEQPVAVLPIPKLRSVQSLSSPWRY